MLWISLSQLYMSLDSFFFLRFFLPSIYVTGFFLNCYQFAPQLLECIPGSVCDLSYWPQVSNIQAGKLDIQLNSNLSPFLAKWINDDPLPLFLLVTWLEEPTTFQRPNMAMMTNFPVVPWCSITIRLCQINMAVGEWWWRVLNI